MKRRKITAGILAFLMAFLLTGCRFGNLAESLREQMSQAVSEAAEELTSAASEASEKISEAVSEVSENVSEEISEASEALESLTEKEESSPETPTEEAQSSDSSEETEETTEEEPESETPEPETETAPELIGIYRYQTSSYNSVNEGTYRMLSTMNMHEFSLSDDCMEAYPELLEALEEKRLENSREFDSLHEDLLDAAKKSEDASSSYEKAAELMRADSSIFSAGFRDEYYYAGSVRPWQYSSVLNLDTETGKELQLSDVVQDIPAFLAALKEAMQEHLSAIPEVSEDLIDEAEYFFEDTEPERLLWTVGYDRIRVYFDGGDILPQVFGRIVLDVLFSENREIFTEKALKVPDRYMVTIPEDEEVLLSDGRKLRIHALREEDAYYISGFEVAIDGASVTLEEGGIGIDKICLMHRDGFPDYLYVNSYFENGYGDTYVFDLSGDEAVYCGEYPENIGGYVSYDSEYTDEFSKGLTLSEEATDPLSFGMGSPMHVMSSYGAYRYYKVGEDGLPVPLGEWYEMLHFWTLTLKQPLTVSVFDEATESTAGEYELNTGDEITLYRTNGDRKVLAFAADGTLLLIELDESESGWGHKIDGTDIDDLFDGMQYAG